MTQRIFDVENKKDMQDLWDILPDMVICIEKDLTDAELPFNKYKAIDYCIGGCPFIAINWHDRTVINRPIQEATEQDVGKICAFWNKNINEISYGKLLKIDERFNPRKYQASGEWGFIHCRRLTKQEIEELC